MTLNGRQQYLWRAVDEDGDLLDILVQPCRNRRAAMRFFRKLLKRVTYALMEDDGGSLFRPGCAPRSSS